MVSPGVRVLLALVGLQPWIPDERSGRPPDHSAEAPAVQSIYQAGVPHTDAQGNLRSRRDGASFFPRCIYHAVPGSFAAIRRAGFNCVHTWEGVGIAEVIEELRSAGLQLIRHAPTNDEVRAFGSDPRILGWYLDEEPTGQTHVEMERSGRRDLMTERYRAFVARKAVIKAMDPRHPVFPLDGADIPPGESAWWDTWNGSGDVTAHDNYPLRPWTEDLEALARSVGRAVHLNQERKPVWIALQAFGSAPGLDPPMRMPTTDELRGMAFTAIIHGATGIILFAYDSRVTRDGNVIGIAPDTPVGFGTTATATPPEAARSRALWAGAAALNAELARLAPRLLSPTARQAYHVYCSGNPRTSSPIRTILKEADGGYTLLAVNLEARSLGAGYRFPRSIESVRRLNADGSVTLVTTEGPEFRDALGSFGVAVYEIRLR
jgi:hypothetical protein